jgi:adenylate cyclase
LLQTQRRFSIIISLVLVIVLGAVMILLTLILSSPLDNSTVVPLLASGLVFLVVVLFLSLWLSSFLGGTFPRPSQNNEHYGLSPFVSALPFGSEPSADEGRRVQMTVLYSNIRGFSGYIEHNEAETVLRTLHKILHMQAALIGELNGEVDACIGDKVVAMFPKTDAALDACKAALRVQHTLSRDESNPFDGLKAGIGIHTGEVILGRTESTRVKGVTLIGDTVKTVSLLSGAAAAGQILISEETYRLVGELVHVDGPYRLKASGKEHSMTVYFLKEMLDEAED